MFNKSSYVEARQKSFEFFLEYEETLPRGGNDWVESLIVNEYLDKKNINDCVSSGKDQEGQEETQRTCYEKMKA